MVKCLPNVGPVLEMSVSLMDGWEITSGFAGGGDIPSVTYGWKSMMLACVR
jgi:hypothetical protein